MMNKIIKRIVLFGFFAIHVFSVIAQNTNDRLDSIVQAILTRMPSEAYDPLIPQAFVFDKGNNVFGAINVVENSIDIIRLDGDSLYRVEKVLVDNFLGRHDEHHIYRPQGIAIYENHIVCVASHRDSCYLSILDLHGKELHRFYFKGNATAFSYSRETQQMYIAGQNDLGYDLIVLSTENGIENMSEADAPALHYQKPKKDDIIKETDPVGIGMAAVAMSVVFLALLMLAIVFASTEKVLKAFQNIGSSVLKRRTQDVSQRVIAKKQDAEPSGEEYAAISAAIYIYTNELHDEENAILTIEKTTRAWTPWNAKYFNMNTYFMKKSR